MGAFLLILCGTAGSGKSTLAGAFASRRGAVHLQTDVIRKHMHGLAANARTGSGVNEGIYAPAFSDATYTALENHARDALAAGRAVVADGSFLTRARRAGVVAIARGCGVPAVVVRCTVPRGVQLRRLAERLGDAAAVSEGGPAVMARNELDWEPLQAAEADRVAEIDTAAGLDALVSELGGIVDAALRAKPA